MKSNQTLKNEALAALRGHWLPAVLATLVFALVSSFIAGPSAYNGYKVQSYMQEVAPGSSMRSVMTMMQDPEFMSLQASANRTSSLTTLLEILVLAPLSLGFANAFRRLLTAGDAGILGSTVHFAFGQNYFRKVWGMLLMGILIFLWSLLLLIPGLIKIFSYAMTPYILAEYPELSASEAIHASRLMMKGHKFDLFWLYLSFIGWAVLCILTAGIGFFWLAPYMETTKAAFYEEVKADYEIHGGLF